jgi:hypothetical protein
MSTFARPPQSHSTLTPLQPLTRPARHLLPDRSNIINLDRIGALHCCFVSRHLRRKPPPFLVSSDKPLWDRSRMVRDPRTSAPWLHRRRIEDAVKGHSSTALACQATPHLRYNVCRCFNAPSAVVVPLARSETAQKIAWRTRVPSDPSYQPAQASLNNVTSSVENKQYLFDVSRDNYGSLFSLFTGIPA